MSQIEMECESDSTQGPDYIDEVLLSNQHVFSSNSSQIDNQGSQLSVSSSEQEMVFDSRFDPEFGSSVPLKRMYRKIRKEISPYYTPEKIPCSQYTATILAMFRRYRYQLLRAQRRARCCMSWGKPVLPGRHHTKTIDQRKKGVPSVNMDTSEEEIDFPVNAVVDPMPSVKPILPADIGRKILKEASNQRKKELKKRQGDGDNITSQELKESRNDNDKMLFSEETQIYDPGEIHEKEYGDFVELQPNMMPKINILRGSRKTALSSPIPSPVTDPLLSDTEEILFSSQSTSKASHSDNLSQIPKHSDDEESRSGSQDSNALINRDGEFYSTQVPRSSCMQKDSPTKNGLFCQDSNVLIKQEGKTLQSRSSRTLNDSKKKIAIYSQGSNEREEIHCHDSRSCEIPKGSEGKNELSRKPLHVEISKRKKIDSSDDDDKMIESTQRKKKKLLPKFCSEMKDENLFVSEDNEMYFDSDVDFNSREEFKVKVSKTYSKSGKVEKIHSESIDFDKMMSRPVLKYKPIDALQNLSVSPMKRQSDPKHGIPAGSSPQKQENIDVASRSIAQSTISRKSKKPFTLFYTTTDNLNSEESVKPSLRKTMRQHRSRKDSPDVVSTLRDEDLSLQNECATYGDNQKKERRMEKTVSDGGSRMTQSLLSELREVSTEEEQGSQHEDLGVFLTTNSSIHSPTGRQSSYGAIQVDNSIEENMECPLCCCMFLMSEIERHAATCGEDLYPVEPAPSRMSDVDEESVRYTRSKSARS